MTLKSLVSLTVISAGLLVVSCDKNKEPTRPEEGESMSGQQQSAPAPASVVQEEDAREIDGLKISDLKTVHFDFNMYNIRADQYEVAKKNAEVMKKFPRVRIQIQGNTDDRGSPEYNIALGERRANAVKRFLVEQGVEASRISTVSFGKEKPTAFCQKAQSCDRERVWALNRRADVLTMNNSHDGE